jgi:hypothetical protein
LVSRRAWVPEREALLEPQAAVDEQAVRVVLPARLGLRAKIPEGVDPKALAA